jgi:hypothetical protein
VFGADRIGNWGPAAARNWASRGGGRAWLPGHIAWSWRGRKLASLLGGGLVLLKLLHEAPVLQESFFWNPEQPGTVYLEVPGFDLSPCMFDLEGLVSQYW